MGKPSSKTQQPVAIDRLLPHPARTPMPPELRRGLAPAQPAATMGRRRAKSVQSGYVATPTSARLDRLSRRETVISTLLDVQRAVARGATLMEALPAGLEGWHARQTLGDAIGSVRVPQWDADLRRTPYERRAAVAKALELAGYVRRGGWTVSR